jgi:3-methyladenine DNA glycosylase Tag
MNDVEHLALLVRKLFHSGFNKALVDQKWPAFEVVFHGFDPERVARMDAAEIERVLQDPRIVRHRKKVLATVKNAAFFCEVSQKHGSWDRWLASRRSMPYAERAQPLVEALAHCGPNTVFYYLLEAGEATQSERPTGVK